jgi:NTE family protein
MVSEKKFGLALSGGGYRAAGFHLGTLRKLHKLGLLDRVDVLSTISGGSITGAAFCLSDQSYPEFEQQMIDTLATKSVIGFTLRSWEFIRTVLLVLVFVGLSVAISFTRFAPFAVVPVIILIYILVSFQFRLFPAASVIERAYDSYFFHGKKLPALRSRPLIAIGSTNLQTARHFTFSPNRMGDSVYAYRLPPILFKHQEFPVARAVMASSCVPFAFTPVSIGKQFFADPAQAALIDPKLVDGGVYDNQGVHKLTEEHSEYNCSIVCVSDAGNKLPFAGLYNNTFTLLLRTVDVFMARIKNFQMVQNVYHNQQGKQIAYLSLGWDLDKCVSGFFDNLKSGNISAQLASAQGLLPEWVANPDNYKPQITALLERNCNYQTVATRNLDAARLKAIRNIGTNLICLKRTLIDDMITHSANLTEIQLRLYCPALFA